MRTKKEKGDHFEQEIAELYQLMGYEVRRHVALNGQEVDIIATRNIPGGGPYRVIVECKYRSGTGLAGNAEVQSIAGAFNIARARAAASACTVVSNNGFSLPAQEAAQSAGIYLATKRDLIRGLIDFDSYKSNLKSQYVKDFGDGVESWYIDVRAREYRESAKPLNELIDGWHTSANKQPLALLGGYGTGKTSFCRHYAVRLIDTPGSPIPIILPLRDFQRAVRIESLIRDFLEEQCNVPFPRFDSFWRMYTEGLLLLLFDGFDEMAAHADLSVIEMNLMEIEKFAEKGGNVILTSRPELFLTEKEEALSLRPISDPLSDRIAVYRPIAIDLWTPAQVSQYVKKRISAIKSALPHPPNYYLSRIQRLSALNDMSSRAVHLDLIVKLLPTIMKEGAPITRPWLYQTYIQREFRRETLQNKRLRIITDDKRLDLMRAVAARRFLDSHDELDFQSAKDVISENLDVPASEIEYVTRDFLNRSFLSRKGDRYRFAHRSIGEYLFALDVYDRIHRDDLGFLRSMRNASPTVAGMTLDLFGGPDALEKMLSALSLSRTHLIVTEDNCSAVMFVCKMLLDFANTVAYSLSEEISESYKSKKKQKPAEASKADLVFELLHEFKVCLMRLFTLDNDRSHERMLAPQHSPKAFEKGSASWQSASWQKAMAFFNLFQELKQTQFSGDLRSYKSFDELRILDGESQVPRVSQGLSS